MGKYPDKANDWILGIAWVNTLAFLVLERRPDKFGEDLLLQGFPLRDGDDVQVHLPLALAEHTSSRIV